MSRQRSSGKRILGLDTDALVHWAMAGTLYHRPVRDFLEREVRRYGWRLGITQQVLNEFLHVATDSRRFEDPMPMADALQLSRQVWHSEEVERILPVDVHDRVCELMAEFQLGRKRILDTALAATFEAAGVTRLASLNSRDFKIFPFIEAIDPSGSRE